jgi:uncharacterized membrane protein
MFGFVFGTLCLIGLFKVARHGHGYGHGRWGGRHGRRGFGRGGWMMRGLFERLETTPGQERVILDAVQEVRGAAGKFRDESEQARRDVADAFRGAHFDQEKLRDVFGKFDAHAEDVKKAVMANLSKVHEALDEGQRAELASMLESFGRFGPCGSSRYAHC